LAVYTDLKKEEIITFLSLYNIGNLVSFSGITEGIENSNYHLKTTNGDFILTLFEKRTDKNDLPFFINIMMYLNDRKFKCPKPIIDNKGNYLQILSGKPTVIVAFLEGKSKIKLTIEDNFAVGSTMAKMHLYSHKFNMKRINSLSISGWEKLLYKCDRSISKIILNEIEPNIIKEIKNSLDFCKKKWPNNLPVGFIHGDMFPDNVFFKDNKISGVIDFYFSCTDILVYDLAIAVNAWCFDNDKIFNKNKFKSLIDGYQSIRKLSKEELFYLPLLSHAAALRFLLTRIYDWAHTPKNADVIPKNPKEYIHKMRFHKTISNNKNYDEIQ
jgi:homoserine kinase type II